MSFFSRGLLALYLGLSPVFWWPGISATVFDACKIALFLLGVVFVWSQAIAERVFFFPKGFLGFAGLLVILMSFIGGIAQSDISVSLLRIKDILLCFIMLWTFFMYQRMGHDSSRVFFVAGLIIAFHSLLVVSSRVTGIPHWSGPSEFIAPELWVSGFGSMRTGWSDGIGLFVPVLAGLAVGGGKRLLLKRMVCLTALICIIGSQVVVGGKAGILGSLIGLLIMLSVRGRRKYLLLYLAIVTVAGIFLANYMYERTQIEQVMEQRQFIERLDKFSSGRVSSDIKAIQIGLSQPIQGYGFEAGTFATALAAERRRPSSGDMASYRLYTRKTEIHNLWIRMFVESGIFPPMIFTLIVIIIYSHSRKVFLRYVQSNYGKDSGDRDVSAFGYYAWIVIIIGLIAANLEPRFLLGAFQNSAVWWAVAGACVSVSSFARKVQVH